MMKNKVLIPNGQIAEIAKYKEQPIDEYRNNPFIEALPNILTKEDVIERLICYPPFDEKERLLDGHIRFHIVQRLFQYFQPMSIHIDLESRICRMIRQGYVSRNPTIPEFNQVLQIGYHAIKKKDMNFLDSQVFSTTANSLTLIGPSGSGKSSATNKVLSLYSQVIVHSNYKRKAFNQYQVTWLKLDCPHDGSLKGLCIDFLLKIDNILGTDYYKKTLRGNSSANTMLPVICQIARRCGLGILIIDEIQHVSLAKSGGAEKMLNFFVTLINTIGVPVVLIGTNKAMSILQSQFRMARRNSGQGSMFFDRVKGSTEASWALFTDMIFEYQWVKKPSVQYKELRDVLYEESQGILDIAVKLFVMAQVRAISTGKEEITPNLIKYIAKENLKLVKPMLLALKSGNLGKIAQYEDISPIDFDGFMEQQVSHINLDNRIKEKQQLKNKNNSLENTKKEEAIIRLLDLDIEPKVAKKYVEMVLDTNFIESDITDIVKQAFRLIIEDESKNKVSKSSKINSIEYKQDDLRNVIESGKKEKISAYDALKEAGFIMAPIGDFLKVGV